MCRYGWESDAGGKFAISEDTEGEPLGRGTQIKIFLKVCALERAHAAIDLCTSSADPGINAQAHAHKFVLHELCHIHAVFQSMMHTQLLLKDTEYICTSTGQLNRILHSLLTTCPLLPVVVMGLGLLFMVCGSRPWLPWAGIYACMGYCGLNVCCGLN